ncbi:MAG: alpha/beta hydrolase domain-containing protein [Acidobacteriota bacterium]|nr:alpha/beta hydrolase domain-containing protein [Acidobacteriota bacterium]
MSVRPLRGRPWCLLVCFWISAAAQAAAEIVRIDITSREPFGDADGIAIGPYERLRGRVVYALDPDLAANQAIVDLDLAVTDERGRVQFYGDLEILTPVDRALARPTVLYVVNNRGRRTWGDDPFFLRRGYVTVTSGWLAQVPISRDLLRLEAPIAIDPDDGIPVVGTVRAELSTDVPAERLPAGDRNQLAFEPLRRSLEDATLTWRLRERDPPQPIARDRWRLDIRYDGQDEGSGLVEVDVILTDGFAPGVIYELTYEARGSVVQGAGFAAIRDVVSFLKRETSDMNPLRRPDGSPLATRVIAQGRSQSGRALRMFLYEGFNADEHGHQVFDGLMPTVAGGGLGFFNHRFASPTRTATQHRGHLYPVDMFPFTYDDQTDPFTGRTDGLLRRARASGTVPNVMQLDTTSEYWHRSGSLVVTDPLAAHDVTLPPEVRIYVVGGAQHNPGRLSEAGQQPANPNDYRPLQETLFLAMDRWLSDGIVPPRSMYPRIADGTLVSWLASSAGWNPLPGVIYPGVIQQPDRLDYGDRYERSRQIDEHPPRRVGDIYEVRVPRLDADNNELGVIRLPRVAVPVATYTGWNLRHRTIGASDELLDLIGGRIPFPRTEDDRFRDDDPRPAVDSRYASFDDYRRRYLVAADQLIAEGYLLPEHLDELRAVTHDQRPLFER